MPGRLVLLVGSPRIAPGLFTREAWQALGSADRVWARDDDEPLAAAVVEAGVPVRYAAEGAPPQVPDLARRLVAEAAEDLVVWVGSADGDPGLSDAVASEVTRLGTPPDVEVLVGSWDVPGARLLDVVAVMDRLRSPGGCPWDAQQTHASLVRYLLEEAHEAAEAIDSGDRPHMVEELGDVLLQVVFQARVGQEDAEAPFDIDAVAGGLVEKLVRRHPHVFGDTTATSPEEVEQNWERIKAEEKRQTAAASTSSTGTPGQRRHGGGEAGHPDLLDGIPASLSSLLVAEKLLDRLERAGRARPAGGGDPGGRLLDLVAEARDMGESADALLRAELRRLAGGSSGSGT